MWLGYALLTVGLTSILAILMRVLAVRASDERAFAFTYNLIGLLILTTLLLIRGVGVIELNSYLLGLMVISGLGYGLFQRYQFSVRKHIQASEVAIIFTPTNIAGYLLAVVWLHEVVTPVQVLGFALLMVAAFLVISRHHKVTFTKYTVLALAIGVGLAITAPLDRRVSPHFGEVLTYVAVIWLSQTIVTFLPYVKPSAIKTELGIHRWKLPLLVTINLLATYTLIAAIRLAQATKVQPITASNVILVAVLGVVLLKERERVWLKLLAAVLATVGLVLISR